MIIAESKIQRLYRSLASIYIVIIQLPRRLDDNTNSNGADEPTRQRGDGASRIGVAARPGRLSPGPAACYGGFVGRRNAPRPDETIQSHGDK